MKELKIDLSEREYEVVEEIADLHNISTQQVIRNALRTYQSIIMGINQVIPNPEHPLNQLFIK